MASRETDAILKYMKDSGVAFQVSDITGPGHTSGSYHYRQGTGGVGLAVDLDDFSTPQRNTPGLDAIWKAFQPVEHLLAELAYLGAPYNIKHGKRVAPYDKDNHVHVAVERGVFLKYPTTMEPDMPDTPPNHPVSHQPVSLVPTPTGNGYWIFLNDGAVYSFGDAMYFGRVTWQP